MTLNGISIGDIVTAEGVLSEVVGKKPHELQVKWIGRGQVRWVKAREVSAWWKRMR